MIVKDLIKLGFTKEAENCYVLVRPDDSAPLNAVTKQLFDTVFYKLPSQGYHGTMTTLKYFYSICWSKQESDLDKIVSGLWEKYKINRTRPESVEVFCKDMSNEIYRKLPRPFGTVHYFDSFGCPIDPP